MLGISRVSVHNWGEAIPEARIKQLRKLKPSWFRQRKPA